ncbi:hypothetical protein ACWEOO_02375 [Kribbella sp. NPDC004138]
MPSSERHQPAQPGTSDRAAKAELDELMRTFLGAFTNTGGRHPDVQAVREVFIPEGIIIANVGAGPIIYTLDTFIEPRERMLTDGTLTEFSEWEVSEQTEICGTIGHRLSEYRKSGFRDGEPFEGTGYKTTQFIHTPAGWKMTSMAWFDA